MDQDFSSPKKPEDSPVESGNQIPGYFAEDNFRAMEKAQDIPKFRVEQGVETYGYGQDETDEFPHVVEDGGGKWVKAL